MHAMEEGAKRRKRIILIGRSAAGKTTLCQRMNHEELRYCKTQTIEVVRETMIDTPGEYLQRMNFRGALLVTAADVDIIVMVQAATDTMNWFPPAYNTQFAKPAVGVVTKADLAADEEVERAKEYLRAAGAEKIFVTSSVDGRGVDELLEYLEYEKEGAK